ncbi:MAG: DoxX family protein [Pseudomonadota bacterium]
MSGTVREPVPAATTSGQGPDSAARLRLKKALVLSRQLFGVLFLLAFIAKVIDGWLWSDALLHYFNERLSEPPPLADVQRAFLLQFAIPYAYGLGWIVTIGELLIGLGLLLEQQIRWCAIAAVLMMIGFAAGGYAGLSTLFLIALAVAMAIYPIVRSDIR